MSTIIKDFTFSAGSVILSSEHNANFNTIYDDYNGNITDANIAPGASISNAKLNLSNITQGITFAGNTTFSGTTIADLGSVTTADINGGTVDGTNIGGSAQGTAHVSTLKVGTTNQGDVLYDNATSIVRLTPGTSGQFLTTQGAGANPTWTTQNSPGWTFIQSNTFSTSSSVSITETISSGDVYKIIYEGTVSGDAFSGIAITINNDSAGGDYDRIFSSLNRTGANAASTTIDAGDSQNTLTLLDNVVDTNLPFGGVNGEFFIELIVTARNSDTQIRWDLSGTGGDSSAANSLVKVTGVGNYRIATPTSIQLIRGSGTSTITGRNYVFKASIS